MESHATTIAILMLVTVGCAAVTGLRLRHRRRWGHVAGWSFLLGSTSAMAAGLLLLGG